MIVLAYSQSYTYKLTLGSKLIYLYIKRGIESGLPGVAMISCGPAFRALIWGLNTHTREDEGRE